MKKLFFSILLVTLLFTFTGCGSETSSDNLHKQEFVDMRYNEPKNYSKKEPYNIDDNKVLVFRFNEDENKFINLYYKTNLNAADNENKYEEVNIGGVKCKRFHDTDFGITYDTIQCIYNNGLYIIELNAVDKYEQEFEEFLKDVSFE